MPASDVTKMSDQHTDKDRCKFTQGLIRAIEELEYRRLSRSPQQLADAAWQKLQFDLPLVETAELQALLDIFSASFVGKTGWPCYMLTHKALENISNGARGASSCERQLSDQEQEVQQLLAASLTNKVLGRSSSTGSSSNTQSPPQQASQPCSQQELYQQLCAVLLLQYAAKVASLPDQQAWQLMQAYCPEDLYAPEQQQQQQHESGLEQPGEAAAAAAGQQQQPSSCSVYEDTEAAQQDNDSDEYEPLEVPQPVQPMQPYASRAQAQPPSPYQLDPQPFSWPALHHKLLSLADHVHYRLLSYEPLWRQQDTAQHLLQLLRLLGVHSHTQELQTLLHAYVGVLVDRLAAAPQDLPLLHQLWEALGLTLASGLKQPGSRTQNGGPQPYAQQGLYPEAVLGLSVAAAVWQQLPGMNPRRTLWQLMYADLLPLLELCAEQLAFTSTSTRAKSTASSNGRSSGSVNGTAGGAPAAATSQAVTLAHVLLLSHVVELLVLGRPGHVDAGKQLTDLGVTRSLVQLHMQWGAEAAADPLRRALLLSCFSSPHTAAWVLAVPGIKQQLQQQVFQSEGPFEAYGALWQVLLSSNTQPSQSSAAKHTATGAPAVLAGEASQQQLLSLLTLQSSSVQQLQRQVALLQLMVDVQRAAGSRQRLWSDQALAALRKLAAQLKETEGPGSCSPPQTESACGKGSMSDSESDSDAEHVDCTGEADAGTSRRQQSHQQQQTDVQQLEHRRSAQLQPAALRLVKELLTQGGGKTD